MKNNYLGILFLLSLGFLAQAQNAAYSRLKINLEGKNIQDLAALGLEVDHGIYISNRFIINDFSADEIQLIAKAGFDYKVEIEDVQAYYSNQNRVEAGERGFGDCEKTILKYTHTKPKNFKLGTMGGFYTYKELWEEMDLMRAKYPNLISTYQGIDTIKSHEGRPIRWLRISDNPNKEEATESKILYTALHHAREPLGLSQLVYYMWYVLENYDKSLEIKQLVDNTEMYFIPMINPDGYVHNETIAPDGGGMWRKNRRKNSNGTMGVDLNRNYGHEWGFNNQGSSPNAASDTYRGPSAFSEPETRAVKFFSEQHKFKVALNYHAFGNLLIYPWGYNDSLAHPGFRDLGALFASENNYKAGTGVETVGYNVNGDSDDWMWGAAQIFALTPEISTLGFWPTINQITPVCSDVLSMNIYAGQVVGSLALVRPANTPVFLAKASNLSFEIKRYGFDSQAFNFKVTPLTGNIKTAAETQSVSLNQYQTKTVSFPYVLNDNVKSGETVKWLTTLSSANNSFVKYDTITSYFGGVSVLKESGDNLSNWSAPTTANTWGLSTKIFKSAPSAITDSPSGLYKENVNTTIRTNNYITIPKKKKVTLRYWAKWDIEKEVDYAATSISEDNFNYVYACGRHTRNGGFLQLENEPIYDGQSDWVLEEIDMTDYAGLDVLIRFTMFADYQNNKDGIYIDDIEIIAEDPLSPSSSETITLGQQDFEILTSPNPASDVLNITTDGILEGAQLVIYSATGQLMQRAALNSGKTSLDVSNFAKGVYYYQIQSLAGEKSVAQRWVKM